MRRAFIVVVLSAAGCGPSSRPAAEKAAEKKPEAARPVRIVHFYASPGVLEAGGRALLCYGVENARTVRLDPAADRVWPAYNRCIEIAPVRDSRYTLTAEGFDGRRVSESLEVKVRRSRAVAPPPEAAPLISEFAATAAETAPGRPVTLCYQAAPGAEIRLAPEVERPAGSRACFAAAPLRTTTYTLTASTPDGRTQSRSVTITVR